MDSAIRMTTTAEAIAKATAAVATTRKIITATNVVVGIRVAAIEKLKNTKENSYGKVFEESSGHSAERC